MRLSIVKSFPPKILKEHSNFCISLYLPTNSNNRNQDIRNFKALVDVLEASKTFSEQVAFLREIQNDLDFWKNNLNSLAILMNQDHVAINKLMMIVEEQIHISDHFHVLPLIENYQKNHRYFLMLLKESSFKLYFGNLYGVFELDIIDKLRINENLDNEQYYQIIDQFIHDNFTAVYKSPLLISATQPIQESFRSLSQNPNLLSMTIDDIPMDATQSFVHRKSWQGMDTLHEEKISQFKADFPKLEKNNCVISNVEHIIDLMTESKIDYLILNRQATMPGFIGKDGTFFEINEHGDSLINHLAELALKYDSEVVMLDENQMPSNDNILAILSK